MPEAIETQIAELARLSGEGLRQRFEEAFGKAPALRASAELLRLALAYRLQERALGGLSTRSKRLLGELEARKRDGRSRDVVLTVRIKPGTRLVRKFNGEQHQVTVLEQGFEYQGRRYGNLTAIAREITGTEWSGPVFFGLKKPERGDQARG